MSCYEAQSFHVSGAIAACMLAEHRGDDPSLVYSPDVEAGFPPGLSWRELAQAISESDCLSVDTLGEAPYRMMIGNDLDADAIGWIDVSEDADRLGSLQDSPAMGWIS